MILRQLGLYAQELESGPFTFLLSHSIPVAYRDARPEAPAPGLYRTDAWYSKGTTQHLNKWLASKGGRYSTVPHDLVLEAFQGISRYSSVPERMETEAT